MPAPLNNESTVTHGVYSVEARKPDIIDHQLPNWRAVKEREFLHWDTDLVLDTSNYSADQVVEIILSHISKHMER